MQQNPRLNSSGADSSYQLPLSSVIIHHPSSSSSSQLLFFSVLSCCLIFLPNDVLSVLWFHWSSGRAQAPLYPPNCHDIGMKSALSNCLRGHQFRCLLLLVALLSIDAHIYCRYPSSIHRLSVDLAHHAYNPSPLFLSFLHSTWTRWWLV